METSIHYRSFQQKCYQKDASFSSYLRPQPPPPPPPPKSPPPPSQEPNESTVDDSDQISVFEAENYFSESSSSSNNNNNNNEHKEINKIASSSSSQAIFPPDQRSEFSIVSRLSSVSSDDRYRNGRNYRTHSFHATPTASSEASWNSQTGLLSNPPGSIAVSLKNLPTRDNLNNNGERFSAKKWFLGRKCPCSGKKSVEVKEKSSIVKASESKKLESNQSVIESEFRTVFTKQQSVKKSHLVESSEMLVPNLRRVSSQKCSMNDVIESSEKVDPNSRRFSSQSQFSSNAAEENRHHHHHHCLQFNDGTGFSFPILNQSSKIMLKGAQTSTPMEDPPRDSLEVFQPPEESVSGKSMAVQHRALAAHGGGFAFPASPISRITAATDDDVASDASSDLFEIESLSTQPPLPPPSYPMFFRRDSLDEAATFNARRQGAGGGVNFRQRSSNEAAATPSIAVADCYEPSEASIDWSVTTAEGFDRASVTNLSISASDIEEFATIQELKSGGGGSGGGRDGSRRRLGNYGGLLSCRCEKAVSVGPPPRF